MKQLFLITLLAGTIHLFTAQQAMAQHYRTGLGLFIDVGDGRTLVGPHIKHFFNGRDAGQAMVLFTDGATLIGAEYSYNKPFPNTNGLSWNIGVGPQAYITDYKTWFWIRPQVGLEFKTPGAPIALGFDWRPIWQLSDDTDFEPGRFGITFKYTLGR